MKSLSFLRIYRTFLNCRQIYYNFEQIKRNLVSLVESYLLHCRILFIVLQEILLGWGKTGTK